MTDGSGRATQAATGVDLNYNAYISSVMDERIAVRIIGPNLDADVPIQTEGVGQADPDFATSYLGVTYMVFTQLDPEFEGEGREVYLGDNEGGGDQGFAGHLRITHNRVEDYAPRLVLDFQGKPHIAWAQKVGEQDRVLYWRNGLSSGQPIVAAEGDFPHLFVDQQGIVHLVYSRQNDVWYINNVGNEFHGEVAITTTPRQPESSVSIGGDPFGRIVIAYESRNTLYFSAKPSGGAFIPPRLIHRGGVLDPHMRVGALGQLTIAYVKDGDIFYVRGLSDVLTPPERITFSSGVVETRPSVAVDSVGNLHVSYLREGDVYYVNNAAKPVVEFSATPTIGESPLKVQFGDLSSGHVRAWEWDFGDGTTSAKQHPTHVYEAPGKYTVKLKVVSAGLNESIKEREDFITVHDPYYTMRIPNQRVFPQQKDVWFPVITGRKERIQGFQLMGTFDPNYLILKEFTLLNTVLLGRKAPEFFQTNDRGTYFEVGCIFELQEPIVVADQYLPPGELETMLNIVFDVSHEAPQGAKTLVSLVNDSSISRIFNIFTVEGFTKLPALTGSTVSIEILQAPLPRFFLRGDADGDGQLRITDAIKVLAFLFAGGSAPPCLDAADTVDGGQLNITSPVALLYYLFLGGPAPSVPFPSPGLDPTEDPMPDCF